MWLNNFLYPAQRLFKANFGSGNDGLPAWPLLLHRTRLLSAPSGVSPNLPSVFTPPLRRFLRTYKLCRKAASKSSACDVREVNAGWIVVSDDAVVIMTRASANT
jgi:hypothetical protein